MKRDADPADQQQPATAQTRLWLALCCLLLALLSGCAAPKRSGGACPSALCSTPASPRADCFDFDRDTLAFANELTWIYGYDANGHWTAHAREPKPDYSLHCFVVARSAEQFFRFARFAPQQPVADDATYRRLIRRVVSLNPRKRLPEPDKIVFPGYADLKSFSAAHAQLLKDECGGALESYFQRGHWRMVLPFSRGEQEKMARQLVEAVHREGAAVAHIVRFPALSINHALLLFEAEETSGSIDFLAYDPNDPSKPLGLTFERETRRFVLPVTHYYPGGRVDVYQVYHRWNY